MNIQGAIAELELELVTGNSVFFGICETQLTDHRITAKLAEERRKKRDFDAYSTVEDRLRSPTAGAIF